MSTAPTTFSYNGISSTTIPELLVTRVRRPIVGSRRDDFVSVPGREGFWIFSERAGPRVLSLELDVQADSYAERRAAVLAVADLFDSPASYSADPDTLARLIVDDEPDRFHRCRLSSAPDPEEWLNYGAFSVDLTAEPYALALTPTTETYTAASATAHAFTIPDHVFGVPEIVITANGGTATSLVVDLNGTILTYATGGLGLTTGQSLTVSTLGYVVTSGTSGDTDLDGTFDPADLDMSTVSGDFGYVDPGANTVTVTRTGGASTLTVTVRWRRRFR